MTYRFFPLTLSSTLCLLTQFAFAKTLLDYPVNNIPASPQVTIKVGNPINILTGNKFQEEVDIPKQDGLYSLGLHRYYNSKSTQIGIFGYGWRSDYEMQLKDNEGLITVLQSDGSKVFFHKTSLSEPLTHTTQIRYQNADPSLGYILRTPHNDKNNVLWQWYTPRGRLTEFIAHRQVSDRNGEGRYEYGQIVKVTEDITIPKSPYWAMAYDTRGRLSQVQNHKGEVLNFIHSLSQPYMPKITINSTQGNWQYFLNKQGNLTDVLAPNGEHISYEYRDRDKHNLTAKITYDKAGKTIDTSRWQYDHFDRAVSSMSGINGRDNITIDFDPNTSTAIPSGQIFRNTLTNAKGEKTVYRYQVIANDIKLLSAIGAGCTTCGEVNMAYAYDNIGRLITRQHLDNQGKVLQTEHFKYDSQGNLIQ